MVAKKGDRGSETNRPGIETPGRFVRWWLWRQGVVLIAPRTEGVPVPSGTTTAW